MYCEYCDKKIKNLKRGAKTHTNICQPIKVHYFCCRECKDKWCFAVQKDEIEITEQPGKPESQIKEELADELHEIHVIKEYLSDEEYAKRLNAIINKKEYKDINVLQAVKGKDEYEDVASVLQGQAL
ncbi:MAG: hypothetical protein R6U96_08840 [Promethearchaeia archaeon]